MPRQIKGIAPQLGPPIEELAHPLNALEGAQVAVRTRDQVVVENCVELTHRPPVRMMLRRNPQSCPIVIPACCVVVLLSASAGTEGDEPGAVPSLKEMSLVLCPPFVSLHTTRKLMMLLIYNVCGPLADPRIEENINQGGVELRSIRQHKIYGIRSQSEPYICLNHPYFL